MATEQKILIDKSPGETRVAVIIGGRLAQLSIERSIRPWMRGAIVCAKITAIRKELRAAFVDLGETTGYMEIKTGQLVREGDSVIVEVISEPHQDKSARVSQSIAFRGPFINVLPKQSERSISRKIKAKRQRNLIKDFIKANVPDQVGVHIKSSFDIDDLCSMRTELKKQLANWNKLKEFSETGPSPKVFSPAPGPVDFAVKNYQDATIDEGKDGSVFNEYKIDFQIEKALERRVILDSGAHLIIDELEALTSIDIDIASHKMAITHPFFFAEQLGQEIYWQLRLRDIAGLILIDFPRWKDLKIRDQFVAVLKALAGSDDKPLVVHGWTKTGLLEITCSRVAWTLKEILLGTLGDDSALLETAGLKLLRRLISETKGIAYPKVLCSSQIKAIINGPLQKNFSEVTKRLGTKIELIEDPNFTRESFEIINGSEGII